MNFIHAQSDQRQILRIQFGFFGIVQKHVSEAWSPPRVTALASKYGLTPGSAYDIETNDSNGKAWDVDIPEQRNRCVREILEQRP